MTDIAKNNSTAPQKGFDIPATLDIRGTEQKPYITKSGVGIHWYTTNTTLKKTGPRIRLARYDRTIEIYKKQNPRRRIYSKDNKKRSDNIKRSRQRVLDLAMSNWPQTPKRYQAPVFLTLTYKDTKLAQPENRQLHIRHQQDFFKKLRARFGKGIRYISVFELQNKTGRNAVHIHAVIFNLPFHDMADLQKMWPHSTKEQLHVRRCKAGKRNANDNAVQLSNYVTKYLAGYVSKDLDQVAGYYEKTYLPSYGLDQPVTISRADAVSLVLNTFVEMEKFSLVHVTTKKYVPHFDAYVIYEIYEPPN